ncbi:MAG: CBS domain-containing protein [Nitrososphaerota archaeon]|nr:CBS domain-containing protein [Candidatus Calditenuaceae archaeon]MDW8072870.1 CBS domain-containing protein [Nitrososphaerota archaeon]
MGPFLSEEITVREVMTSPVIELDGDSKANEAGEIMAKYRISSILVRRGGNPVGIVTKRDLVEKVVALDKKPSEVRLEEIMSSPLVTISPSATLEEAVRLMTRLGISRLIVSYKGNVQGIISLKDVLKITPDIIAVIKEQFKLSGGPILKRESYLEGYCDSCGEWSDMLVRIDDQYVCEECRLELEKGSVTRT